ncbi:MAG: hypothetical protein P8J87_01265 [Verrucomicrobiales bacterium]|nr:hypothetical protein [Verrucomicrobiales bacterium]
MRQILYVLPLLLTACSTAQHQQPHPNIPASSGITLSPAQAQKIGQKIWQNECAGTVDGLTSWNDGEDFASLGIGHFIWYPAGKNGPFTESFPQLVAYLKARRVPVPTWLDNTPDCPWRTKSAFLADFHSPRSTGLRTFLKNTVPQQTGFIVQRLEAALPKMLAAAPAADRNRVRHNFYATAKSSNGIYALIDYVNFKGEGTNPSERYHGKGWGLLQVLQNMRGTPSGATAASEFAAAAARTLSQRVANAPAARNESRWLKGWHSRCASYARPF